MRECECVMVGGRHHHELEHIYGMMLSSLGVEAEHDAVMPRRSGRATTKRVRYADEMVEEEAAAAMQKQQKCKASKSAMHSSSSSSSACSSLQPVEVQVEAFGMNEATVKEVSRQGTT